MESLSPTDGIYKIINGFKFFARKGFRGDRSPKDLPNFRRFRNYVSRAILEVIFVKILLVYMVSTSVPQLSELVIYIALGYRDQPQPEGDIDFGAEV